MKKVSAVMQPADKKPRYVADVYENPRKNGTVTYYDTSYGWQTPDEHVPECVVKQCITQNFLDPEKATSASFTWGESQRQKFEACFQKDGNGTLSLVQSRGDCCGPWMEAIL